MSPHPKDCAEAKLAQMGQNLYYSKHVATAVLLWFSVIEVFVSFLVAVRMRKNYLDNFENDMDNERSAYGLEFERDELKEARWSCCLPGVNCGSCCYGADRARYEAGRHKIALKKQSGSTRFSSRRNENRVLNYHEAVKPVVTQQYRRNGKRTQTFMNGKTRRPQE